MFTIYLTSPRTQISVTVPKFETALYILTHLRCTGRKVRIWSHTRRQFV